MQNNDATLDDAHEDIPLITALQALAETRAASPTFHQRVMTQARLLHPFQDLVESDDPSLITLLRSLAVEGLARARQAAPASSGGTPAVYVTLSDWNPSGLQC